MKVDQTKRKMGSRDIEESLKSAVDALAPDIFGCLDLSIHQQREMLEMTPFLEEMKKNKIS